MPTPPRASAPPRYRLAQALAAAALLHGCGDSRRRAPPSPSASHAEIAPRRSGDADVASATADDATTPCAALPVEPPPGLALRVTQADLGPQVLTNRWRSGMIALDPVACAQLRPRLPADGCHRLAPDAFARLYGELRRGGIHRIRVRTSEPASPHRGGWALGVQGAAAPARSATSSAASSSMPTGRRSPRYATPSSPR